MDNVLYLSTGSGANFFECAGKSLGKLLAGIDVALYPLRCDTDSFTEDLVRALSERKFEFALSFIGIGKRFESDGIPLTEVMSLPLITIYGDSPSYFFDIHTDHSTWDVSLYAFKEHLAFRERFSVLDGFHGLAPLTPAAPLVDDPIDWGAKENGKLIFLKSAHDPKFIFDSWAPLFQKSVANALMEIAHQMAGDLDRCSHDDIVANVLSYMNAMGLHAGTEKLLLLMVAQLDHYLRAVKAALVADAALDFPVEIHGLNWGHVRSENRRGKIIEHADYMQSESLIRGALATLDTSPNVTVGAHDRIARSACHETFCLTNAGPNAGIELLGREGMSYRFERAAIADRIDWILSHRKETIELGIEFARQFRDVANIENTYSNFKRIADFVKQSHVASRPPDMYDCFVWPPERTVKSSKHKPVFHDELVSMHRRMGILEAWVQPGRAVEVKAAKPEGFLKKLFSSN